MMKVDSYNLTPAFQRRLAASLRCALSVMGTILVATQLYPQSIAAQEVNKSPKSVSTRGVARIHERDFPTRSTQPEPKIQQANTRFLPDSTTSPKIQPLPVNEPKTDLKAVRKPDPSGSNLAAPNQPIPEPLNSGESVTDLEKTSISESVDDTSRLEVHPSNGIKSDQESTGDSEEDQSSPKPQQSPSWSFDKMTDRKSLPSTIQMFVSVAAISLVPAILLMTTCFIRIVVVLGILRQAIGLQQLPPTQVTTGLALMMTFLIMAPTWKEVKEKAVDPYTAEESTMSWDEAWQAGVTPVKKFMWGQIRRAENEKDFWVFYDYLPEDERSEDPSSLNDVPLKVLLPAFMISELKVAFLIGIQILLPFLILDIVVASLCNTMGLIMLPPAVVSLPLKLLLFVMVDGWNLVVAMLLNSFAIL